MNHYNDDLWKKIFHLRFRPLNPIRLNYSDAKSQLVDVLKMIATITESTLSARAMPYFFTENKARLCELSNSSRTAD